LAVPTAAALRLHNGFETIVSALVIAVALAFLVFIQIRTGTGRLGSYELRAKMPSADGLKLNADVRVGGIKVGSITGLDVASKDYSAIVAFQIRDDLFLPTDSVLSVTSPGLGDPYLTIQPGHSRNRVAPGGVFPLPAGRAALQRLTKGRATGLVP